MDKTRHDKEHQAYILKLETELHELEQREEAATRRMQLLVYPATFAFVILSAYGFYLVSTLTSDIEEMAHSVETMYNTVDNNMQTISTNTINMSDHMTDLIQSTEAMSANVANLTSHTKKMSTNVEHISFHTGYMQQDVWALNKSISKPMGLFNNFMPWSYASKRSYAIPATSAYNTPPPTLPLITLTPSP